MASQPDRDVENSANEVGPVLEDLANFFGGSSCTDPNFLGCVTEVHVRDFIH